MTKPRINTPYQKPEKTYYILRNKEISQTSHQKLCQSKRKWKNIFKKYNLTQNSIPIISFKNEREKKTLFSRKAKGDRVYELQEKLQEDFQAEGKEYRQKLRSHTDTDTHTHKGMPRNLDHTHTHKGMPRNLDHTHTQTYTHTQRDAQNWKLGKWDISVQIFNR